MGQTMGGSATRASSSIQRILLRPGVNRVERHFGRPSHSNSAVSSRDRSRSSIRHALHLRTIFAYVQGHNAEGKPSGAPGRKQPLKFSSLHGGDFQSRFDRAWHPGATSAC